MIYAISSDKNQSVVLCKILQNLTLHSLLFCYGFFFLFLYARLEMGSIMWLGMTGVGRRAAGGHPHRFPHDNFSSVYWIFTKLGNMIALWKGKNPIYCGIIMSKVKVTVTINKFYDNWFVSAR